MTSASEKEIITLQPFNYYPASEKEIITLLLSTRELASDRWNPAQNVRTILMSIVSLLNSSNQEFGSNPGNVITIIFELT